MLSHCSKLKGNFKQMWFVYILKDGGGLLLCVFVFASVVFVCAFVKKREKNLRQNCKVIPSEIG